MTAYRNMRVDFAEAWGAAWQRHRDKLADGGKQADAQNDVQDFVVGGPKVP